MKDITTEPLAAILRVCANIDDMEERLGYAASGRISIADSIRANVVRAREASDRDRWELTRLRVGIEAIAASTGVARDANEDLLGWLERALARDKPG